MITEAGTLELIMIVLLMTILVIVAVIGLYKAAQKSDDTWILRRTSLDRLERARANGRITEMQYRLLKRQLSKEQQKSDHENTTIKCSGIRLEDNDTR